MYENHKKVSLYLILLMASSFTIIFQFPLQHKFDYRIEKLFFIESKKIILIKFADLVNLYVPLSGLQNFKVLKGKFSKKASCRDWIKSLELYKRFRIILIHEIIIAYAFIIFLKDFLPTKISKICMHDKTLI